MKQTPSTPSHRSLALILALLVPGLASAQSVSMSAAASGSAATAGGAAASARAATVVAPISMSIMPSSLSLTPTMTLSAPNAVSVAPLAVMAAPSAAAPIAVVAVPVAAAAPVIAAPVAAFVAPQAALGALTQTVNADAKTTAAKTPSVSPTSFLFDGASARRAIDDAAPVAASALVGGPAALERPAAVEAAKPAADLPLPAPAQPARGRSLAVKILLAAALLIAFPSVALAAAAAPALAGAASLAFLASVHPMVSAVAAAAGAVYGLIAARHKDGTPATTGEAMTSMLRYGMLAGAGAYILLDLTQLLFLGASAAGLKPLSTAVATAALGQSAFQGTFKDPATSSADRIMSAFPAVAAALGLSVGIVLTLAVPTTFLAAALSLAVGVMSVTGVAAALFSALYTPGKSPENGPTRMARGYVLQALMTGMALALSNPYFVVPFLLLGAWGFWDVISTTVREIASRLPASARQN